MRRLFGRRSGPTDADEAELRDAEREIEALEEAIRPPPGSAEAAAWIPTDDPRLRVLREVPVGSCVNPNIGADKLDHGFLEVPCSEPHVLELFGRGDVDPSLARYPDAKTLAAEGDRVCRPLFEEYVGLDYNLSEYTFWAYYPQPDRWPDDRTIHCTLGNASLTHHDDGAAKASRR